MTGSLTEGLRGIEHELGVYSQGGKGATSRKTPLEIRERCDQLAIDSDPLVYASRMAAKVDSAAVQDGYQLYHHAFLFSRAGLWWLSESMTSFVNEPHEAICVQVTRPRDRPGPPCGCEDLPTLDMPKRHPLELRDVAPRRLESVLLTTYERAPRDFETLHGMEGVGARTLRALAVCLCARDGAQAG